MQVIYLKNQQVFFLFYKYFFKGTKKITLPIRKITGSPIKSIKHDAAKIYA